MCWLRLMDARLTPRTLRMSQAAGMAPAARYSCGRGEVTMEAAAADPVVLGAARFRHGLAYWWYVPFMTAAFRAKVEEEEAEAEEEAAAVASAAAVEPAAAAALASLSASGAVVGAAPLARRGPPSEAAGTAHVQSVSMPRLSLCILMRKKPASPQYVPQLLRPIQYLTPSSVTPKPAMLISWSCSVHPVASWNTPPLYASNSAVTHRPQAMGPRAKISASMWASPATWPCCSTPYTRAAGDGMALHPTLGLGSQVWQRCSASHTPSLAW
mmetsp:Transcript_6344/g.16132  ORF Transcript_6344/g.16132 Transcript_6344/m.16132 type:complete len:270 (+) Transcript_6344:809-1618(+)